MKLRYSIAASLMAISVATVVAAPAAAQQITTGIQGQVNDDSGAAISGANVVITDTRTGAARTITTGADGRFATTGLTTGGPYTISVNAGSYEGQTIENVFTTLQGSTNLTFALASGGGEIVVTGSRVRVSQLAVGPGISFSSEVLENAPTFNRDVRDIIRLDPRVSLDREDTASGGSGVDRISCLGGNDRGNAFTVDGIPQSDIYGLNDTGFSSRSSTPVPYDAVRETQVQFAPFDVDYGQFTGCAINVITKSGSNEFHGTAFYEYSDSDWRGDELPGRAVGGVDNDISYGATLGGPLIKDKLFFFAAYEHREGGLAQDEGPTGGNFANPMNGISVEQFNEISDVLREQYGFETGPLVNVRPFENDRYFGRLDWQITDDHRLELSYQRLEENTVRSDDFFTGSSPQVTGLNSYYNSGTQSDYYSARLYSQWNDRFSTELRYSYSDITDIQDPIGGGEAQSNSPLTRIIVGVDNAPLGSSPQGQTPPDGTVLFGPGANRSANSLFTELHQFRAVARLNAGDHRLKFGFELNHASLSNLFINNATGTLVFRNVNDLRAGLLSPGTGNNQTNTQPFNVVPGATEGAFGNFTPTGDPTTASAQFDRAAFSVYAQDDWRINDRLSMVAGMRVDWFDGGRPTTNPNFQRRYGITNATGFSNVAPVLLPRVAFTYEPDDFSIFSRTQIRAGVGIFSGGDPLVWFGNAFQNNGQALALGTSQASGCPTGQISVLSSTGQFTGFPTCVQQAASATAAAGQGFTQAVDPDIQMPTVLRANIGFQTEMNFTPAGFFSGWNVNLDYIYSRYDNPFTMVDLSQVVDPRIGLNGFAIDGRPIYRTIDPLLCGATLIDIAPTPIYSGVTNSCFTSAREDELVLTNAGSYRSHIASFVLSKNFDGGIFTENGSTFFSIGYSYTDAQDRRNMYNSTAGSNYDNTAAFDRQDPDASRGFYSSKHNITVSTSFAEEFVAGLQTRFGASFIARSGRPYSLTFGGSGVFNDSASGSNNALLYVPTGASDPNISPTSNATAVTNLATFLQTLGCARDYAGRTIERNTCSNDWYFDLDLSFSQEIPGPGTLFGMQDKIKLFATVDNFLNLLDSGWNTQRRREFAGRQDVASISGLDAQGRYIITAFNGVDDFNADNFINVSSSVWRLKVGVSYEF